MTREQALVLVLALLAIALFGLWWGWRNRTKKYADLPAITELALSGELCGQFNLFYVATTEQGSPLERVAVRPLAFRGRCHLGVHTDGLDVSIVGEPSAVIPVGDITGVGVATWTIDKSVEQDGLIFVRWQWGNRSVESYFRAVDHARDDVIDAVSQVVNQHSKESDVR